MFILWLLTPINAPLVSQKKSYSIIFINTTLQCNYLRNFELKAPSLIYTEISTCALSESYCKDAGVSA